MKQPLTLHTHLHPEASALRPFVETLPATFEHEGKLLYRGRNTLKAFALPGTGRVVVKRYGRPNPLNTYIYFFLRKGKSRRAFEHAERLRALGIDTPEALAYVECRNRHHVVRESYFVSRHTNYLPLTHATAAYPQPEAVTVLKAFARFAATLHEKGVLHHDFNQNNILYRLASDGTVRFQLIDTNRMSFIRRTSRRDCLTNLCRLSCPAEPFLFIIGHYADARGWDVNDNLLRGILSRLLFERRQQLKGEIKRHRLSAKKPRH